MEKVSINLGVIDPLLRDPGISEIMVNRFDQIFTERDGRISETNLKFSSESSLNDLIQTIARSTNREISFTIPFMDAYLPDGSRVNAVIPPMAPKGATLTIRKFRASPFRISDLIKASSLSEKAAYFLHACVISKLNIVVSGGTGTGKTTFLNTLASLIPHGERIITIEDVAELQLPQLNCMQAIS